jgi:aminomuconate-semialdehyde/2-hydroxymuconate-6-semialdehyde dehydrogenase
MQKILNFIGGEFREPREGNYLENENPATGKAYSLVPSSGASDAEDAVLAAESAFPAWSHLSFEERSNYLRKVALKIRENASKLAHAESVDTGKPLGLATSVDIPRSSANFDFFAGLRLHGESFEMDGKALNYTSYAPLGVVACISPWNLPLYLLTWKIAPALAAGNTVVAKPSEVTPMTAFLLSELVQSAGLPPGVLNIIHGPGPAAALPLVKNPRVRAVSFTGSTSVGRTITTEAAASFKKISLEMGGKNPTVVFADADLESAVVGALRAAFSNQGQICLCGSRILVEKPIYAQFRERLLDLVLKLRQGDPLDLKTDQGALVSKAHMQKVLTCLETAKAEGGKILCGGKRSVMAPPFSEGYFIEPTLIEGLSSSCKTNQEEIFGPVATLAPFENEAEAVQLANDSRYGLSASIWTSDLAKGHRVASKLQSGVVWVNTWMLRDLRTPFGGAKESGVGREGGLDGLRFFSEVKNTCVAFV